MSVLPIVSRELRVAARKRSTFWMRVASASTAVVLGCACLVLTNFQGTSTAQMGSILFYSLSWTGLAAALGAGLFYTSDCLSEEKREGTLGFLFLTDLRGYDVVLGKLMATSLRGFYALLAFLPILAITQMMGGVTAAQYWKSSLALVNALFCSLAAGMLISSLSRDSQKAMSATLLLLLLLALGGPAADAIIAATKKRGFQPLFSLSSPGYLLFTASAWGRTPYMAGLLITQLISWSLFALACGLVPHTWQERKSTEGAGRGWSFALRYGGAKGRAKLRRKLLQSQPITWLACRERLQMLGLWTMALMMAGAILVVLIRETIRVWITWTYFGWILILVMNVWAGSQACRFLLEMRRNGFLELLLVTPITARQVIVGQWRGSLKMFGLPVLLLVSANAAGTVLSQLSLQSLVSGARSTTTVATNQTPVATNQSSTTSTTMVSSTVVTITPGNQTNAMPISGTSSVTAGQQFYMAVVMGGASALSTMGSLLALTWFGMWMGLTSRTANLATLKTILFVQIIPWFAIAFGSIFLMGFLMRSQFAFNSSSSQPNWWLSWWPLLNAVLSTGLALIKDIVFILWSRQRLHSTLRERAAIGIGQAGFIRSQSAPPTMPIPTIVAGQT